jgi:hypothetical protein
MSGSTIVAWSKSGRNARQQRKLCCRCHRWNAAVNSFTWRRSSMKLRRPMKQPAIWAIPDSRVLRKPKSRMDDSCLWRRAENRAWDGQNRQIANCRLSWHLKAPNRFICRIQSAKQGERKSVIKDGQWKVNCQRWTRNCYTVRFLRCLRGLLLTGWIRFWTPLNRQMANSRQSYTFPEAIKMTWWHKTENCISRKELQFEMFLYIEQKWSIEKICASH